VAINPNPYGPGPQDIRRPVIEPLSPRIPPLDRWKEADRIKREEAIRPKGNPLIP